MKKFTLEFKKAVVDDFNSDKHTVAQVASIYGVSQTTIYKWATEFSKGVLRESHRGNFTPRVNGLDYERIKEMYMSGEGIRSISMALNITPTTVKYHLKKLGVYGRNGDSYRNHRKLSHGDLKDIENLYMSSDLTVREIAEKYGVTGGYIFFLMNERGLKRPEHLVSCKRGRPGKRHGISDSVISDYETGLYTHKNLSRKYGVSMRTISIILSAAGLKAIGMIPHTPSHVVAQLRGGVLAALAEGKTVYEVAELHKIPVDTVERIAGGGKESEDSVPETPVGLGAGVEDKVVSLHEGGRKMTEIAEELGLTAYTVRKVLVEHGLDTKMVHVEKPSGTKSDRLREAVLADHKAGMDVKSLAERHGLSIPTVRKLVGVEPKVSKSERVRDDVLAAHIAARCGVSIPTVRKVLREAGVVPHKHTVHDDATGCGEGKPLLSAQQQEELNQVVDQVGSKAAEGIVSQEATGP